MKGGVVNDGTVRGESAKIGEEAATECRSGGKGGSFKF